MAREKFVVRLLDKDAQLLAWAEVYADPKPQERGASCPYWPTTATQFVVERDGVASEIAVHWCDLDVARRSPVMEPVEVKAGQVFSFSWAEPIWLVAGMRDVPLPAVTIHQPIAIEVPKGSVMAVAS
jgi:hypothetical protein